MMQTYATREAAAAAARAEGRAKFDALTGPGTFFREAFRFTPAEVADIAATVVPHFAPRVERLELSTQAGPLERWYLVGWTPPPTRPDAHYHAWSGGSHTHPVTEQQKGGEHEQPQTPTGGPGSA
jgi:hypothetical protein